MFEMSETSTSGVWGSLSPSSPTRANAVILLIWDCQCDGGATPRYGHAVLVCWGSSADGMLDVSIVLPTTARWWAGSLGGGGRWPALVAVVHCTGPRLEDRGRSHSPPTGTGTNKHPLSAADVRHAAMRAAMRP